jgi:flagellar biosynthetic protein FliQ
LNEAEALDIVRSALWTVIVASAPPVLAAMLVGIVIAFFQALTQIQEMTLTFIPKMITVFGMLIATGPFIGEQMVIFSQQAFSRMETGFDRSRSVPALGRERSPAGPFELRPGFPELRPPGNPR